MGHPRLWWLLIAPRRDAQTFAVQKPRNEAIKQLILCPTIYVTPNSRGPTGVQNSGILQVFRGSHCCKGNRINGT